MTVALFFLPDGMGVGRVVFLLVHGRKPSRFTGFGAVMVGGLACEELGWDAIPGRPSWITLLGRSTVGGGGIRMLSMVATGFIFGFRTDSPFFTCGKLWKKFKG